MSDIGDYYFYAAAGGRRIGDLVDESVLLATAPETLMPDAMLRDHSLYKVRAAHRPVPHSDGYVLADGAVIAGRVDMAALLGERVLDEMQEPIGEA